MGVSREMSCYRINQGAVEAFGHGGVSTTKLPNRNAGNGDALWSLLFIKLNNETQSSSADKNLTSFKLLCFFFSLFC